MDIFDKGFRPALIGTAAEFGLKCAASNILNEKKIQVLASGSYDNITSFHQYTKDNDIRVKKTNGPYEVSIIQEYSGRAGIQWVIGVLMSAMFEQMHKGFDEANRRLSSIESKIDRNNQSSDDR